MKFTNLISNLEQSRKVILSDQHQSLRGYEVASKVFHTAEELNKYGFGHGKIVIHRMSNSVDCIITFLALIMSDCSVFVSNPYDPIQKFYENIERFLPYALIADYPSSSAIEKRTESRSDVSRCDFNSVSLSANIFSYNKESLASYNSEMKDANVAIFSSGSTGEPKAILHNIESLIKNASMHIEAVGLQEEDTMGITLPLYYSYGLVANLLGSLIAKAKISLHYQTGVADCDWIVKEKITFIGLTPYFAGTLNQPLPGLRVMTLGGDVLHKNRALKLMQDFPDCQFFSTYGLTEAGPRVATWKFEKKVLESREIVPLGKPLRNVKMFLKDEAGNDASYGELVLETPTRFLGYYYGYKKGFDISELNPKEIHTDDLFETYKGNLYFVGRKKQIIIQGGEKLFPVVIESAIQKIDGVIEAKVGSVSDKEKGQVAKAYIVADETVSLASINRVLLKQFTRSLVPAQLEFVDSISRTLTGKAV